MDQQEHETTLQIISQAGQVALEFLRANPSANAEDAGKDYNTIFKEVYQGITDTITK